MARGFDPVATASWHWLRHPAFAEAVDRFLQRESQSLNRVLDELEERSAFRDAAGGSQGTLAG
jgi:predicted N-acyltransferase